MSKESAPMSKTELMEAITEQLHGLGYPAQAAVVNLLKAMRVVEEASEMPPPRTGGLTTVRGYMCLTDWQYEIGHRDLGNIVFPSLHDLQRVRHCWNQCGVVEVEVRSIRTVVPENWDEPEDHEAAPANLDER